MRIPVEVCFSPLLSPSHPAVRKRHRGCLLTRSALDLFPQFLQAACQAAECESGASSRGTSWIFIRGSPSSTLRSHLCGSIPRRRAYSIIVYRIAVVSPAVRRTRSSFSRGLSGGLHFDSLRSPCGLPSAVRGFLMISSGGMSFSFHGSRWHSRARTLMSDGPVLRGAFQYLIGESPDPLDSLPGFIGDLRSPVAPTAPANRLNEAGGRSAAIQVIPCKVSGQTPNPLRISHPI